MKEQKPLILGITIYILSTLSITLFGQTFEFSSSLNVNEYVSGSVLFKFKSNRTLSDLYNNSDLSQYLVQINTLSIEPSFPFSSKPDKDLDNLGRKFVDITNIYELKYQSSEQLKKVMDKLFSSELLEYVQPRFINKAFYIPNDSAVGSQYYLDKIKAYQVSLQIWLGFIL